MRRTALRELDQVSTYEAVAERVLDSRSLSSDERELADALRLHRAELCRRLRRQVSSGQYRLGPVSRRRACVAGKQRLLFVHSLIDRVVVGALARVLGQLLEEVLTDSVYSYRVGRSHRDALRALKTSLRHHAASRPNPRDRGLYVIRGDIRAYGESIPVHEQSPLWPQLEQALQRASVPEGDPFRTLLQQAIRPVVAPPDGTPEQRRTGTPTGSPIQPAINNLYLSPLDERLAKIPGAFYARFGDDFLFAHSDPEVTRRARNITEKTCASLELSLNPDRHHLYYFTKPGRRSLAWPEAIPASHIDYLGFRLSFDGHAALKSDKARALLRELRARLRATEALSRDLEPDARQKLLARVVQEALDPRSLVADARAPALSEDVDDHLVLDQLDYLVALAAAEGLAQRRGPRAFRSVSYRSLRQAGLPSLLHQRNQSHGRP